MRVPAQQAELLVADRVSIDRRDTLAFVFCVEPGWLEAQACLLSESIRRFGGALADGPIYAVQARGTQPLHRDTIAAFTTLGVRNHVGKFNTQLKNVQTTNKVFAVTEIEQIAVEDFLVFLDTDTVLLDEPAEFLLPEGSDLGVQPTVRKFRGSTGIEDPNDPYWRKVYAVCDVRIATTLTRLRLRRSPLTFRTGLRCCPLPTITTSQGVANLSAKCGA